MARRKWAIVGIGVGLLLGSAPWRAGRNFSAAAAEKSAASVLIEGVPHVEQKPDFCGEACAAMYLRKLGERYDQNDVFNCAGLDPRLGRGCYTRELNAALGRIGFQTGDVWHRVEAADAARQLEAQWRALYADLLAGVGSIVCMRFDERPRTTEHFRLILGYDGQRDEVIFHEPAEANGAYRRMPRAKLLSLWPLKYDERTWTVVRLRLASQRIEPAAATVGHSDADFAQHMMKLKQRLPGPEFAIVIERPFVVIGDGGEEHVRRRSKDTVRWAVDLLKKDYFARDPREIIDIWLFKDKESYERNAAALFGEKPNTPYGYYSPRHRALVMNIGTGGGTLVHEIVHPFVAANFPECPSWFNEGLASLYEQSGMADGHIIGRTNWRLPGLQRAIRAKALPKFAELTATSTREFYDDPRGTNYAQARYLCYYLQEQGKLHDFYHQFRRSAGRDPTGYKTLVAVLGERDMADFQRRWEQFVMKLEY